MHVGAVASMTAQLRATGGRTTTPELRSATRLGCHIGLGGRVPAGSVWARASELGYQGGLRGGREKKKEGAGRNQGSWATLKGKEENKGMVCDGFDPEDI
jgi:hypothetical protein